MTTTRANTPLKAHYRLLGMLLEKQDLKHLMAARRQQTARSEVAWLEQRLSALDDEIRGCQHAALQDFEAQGRTLRDLHHFLGEDLVGELPPVGDCLATA